MCQVRITVCIWGKSSLFTVNYAEMSFVNTGSELLNVFTGCNRVPLNNLLQVDNNTYDWTLNYELTI